MNLVQPLLPVAALLLLAGCNRQDTDCLAGIGRKIVDHGHANCDSLTEKVGPSLHRLTRPNGVADKVRERLAWDKELADAKIDVVASEGEVELKGTLKNADQRRRAIELAETTVGVQKVNDGLQVNAEAAP